MHRKEDKYTKGIIIKKDKRPKAQEYIINWLNKVPPHIEISYKLKWLYLVEEPKYFITPPGIDVKGVSKNYRSKF